MSPDTEGGGRCSGPAPGFLCRRWPAQWLACPRGSTSDGLRPGREQHDQACVASGIFSPAGPDVGETPIDERQLVRGAVEDRVEGSGDGRGTGGDFADHSGAHSASTQSRFGITAWTSVTHAACLADRYRVFFGEGVEASIPPERGGATLAATLFDASGHVVPADRLPGDRAHR